MNRLLLRCGLCAGPLFVTLFTIDGATRPDYDPLRQPVSTLALGPRGYIQTINFAVTGALYVSGAVGLFSAAGAQRRRLGPALVAAAGVGLLSSAIFRSDPAGGYPPGTDGSQFELTATGKAHSLVAVPIFIGLPIAALVYGREAFTKHERGWSTTCAATAVGMVATMGPAGRFDQPQGIGRYAGLFQRSAIITGFGWLTLLFARALRLR